jgi:hypothetical protein
VMVGRFLGGRGASQFATTSRYVLKAERSAAIRLSSSVAFSAAEARP